MNAATSSFSSSPSSTSRHDTDVLIVGAGPAGLALAIELGSRSVPCIVVERNDRVGYAPRAKTTNVRTRAHLRRWGIAGRLAEASPLGLDYPSDVAFVTRLAGHPLARFDNAFYCDPAPNPLYPEHAQWIPQYTLERVLKDHAQSLPGVQFRFATELESFEQQEGSVTASLRDLRSGEVRHVRSHYLVGADGARSTVRQAIGATMEGKYGLSRNYNIMFRAPGLAEAHPHGRAIMYWQINGDVPSLIGPMDAGDTWFFMPTNVPADFRVEGEAAADLIRRATGIDLPYEILSTDEWVASRLIADRYRDGRVFLAGDACHLHPPFGGYGMNMGVADGVDLGWKLAATLQGWGGAELLDTYQGERRPVHQFVIDEAVANHAVLGNQLMRAGIEAQTPEGERLRAEIGATIAECKGREFNTLGVVLGYSYRGSPIVVSDGSAPVTQQVSRFVPDACPGALAPHAWLADGRSLYDAFGKDFTLLVSADEAAPDVEQAMRDAIASGVPMAVLMPRHAPLRPLYGARLALIRPDQHVAWRGDSWPAGGVGLLERISGH
jgi:2-polyprenyl-6-methoxyphenol hydroxylase-like FAD-dependent oxidoreductase